MDIVTLASIIESVIDDLPMERRLYPDIYAHEVAVAVAGRIGQQESDAYKKGWDDCAKFAAAQAEMRLSKTPQRTSVSAVRATLPRSGTKLASIYALICKSGDGMTDFEIEEATGMAHQSASAARNVLMNRGLIMDAGETRKNARGLDAIVWIQAHPSRMEPDVRTADVVALPHLHTCRDDRPRSRDTCAGCLAEAGQTGLWS